MDSLVPPILGGYQSYPGNIGLISTDFGKNPVIMPRPVIPVNQNHPAASAARKRTPNAAVRESPPRAAKNRANNALMQHGGASAPPHRCHNVASVDVASVATDAGEKTDAAENATGLASALAVSTATFSLAAAAGSRSNNSSDSEDSDMIGGGADIPSRFSHWGRL